MVPDEVSELVRKILSAIARLRGKFGVGGIAEVLTGTRSAAHAARWSSISLRSLGCSARYATKRMIAMVHRVIESGLARQRDVGSPGKPIHVVDLTFAGIAVMKGAAPAGVADRPVAAARIAPIDAERSKARRSGRRRRTARSANARCTLNVAHRSDRLGPRATASAVLDFARYDPEADRALCARRCRRARTHQGNGSVQGKDVRRSIPGCAASANSILNRPLAPPRVSLVR